MTARDTSDIAEMEATFLRFIGVRDLRVARWAHDGTVVAYSARAPAPGGERVIVWDRATGDAKLHSFCVYHRQYHPNIPVPYNVAMVSLAEGPLLISTVIVDDPAELRVGMALRAAFEASGRLVFHAVSESEELP